MQKLLKLHNLQSDMQYYQMIANGFINNETHNARMLFKSMPRANKVAMLKSATVGGWHSFITNSQISTLFDLL